MRIEKLRRDYAIDVEFVHFPLHPETPPEGMTLDELFGGRVDAATRKARAERMSQLMRAEGLPYGERTHTYNSRLAQELAKWAVTQPGGDAIHDALFKAYFVANRNIGDAGVLLDVARSIGLDAGAAREVLEKRTFEAAVDADWRTSREAGVTGVPTFAAGGYGVVGAQPYEAIAELLESVGARKRGE